MKIKIPYYDLKDGEAKEFFYHTEKAKVTDVSDTREPAINESKLYKYIDITLRLSKKQSITYSITDRDSDTVAARFGVDNIEEIVGKETTLLVEKRNANQRGSYMGFITKPKKIVLKK